MSWISFKIHQTYLKFDEVAESVKKCFHHSLSSWGAFVNFRCTSENFFSFL